MEIIDGYALCVAPTSDGKWTYHIEKIADLKKPFDATIYSDECFETKFRAKMAGVGHITLLRNNQRKNP